MSTQDISRLLERISGLNVHQLPMYQQAVLDNNINGAVLNMCDIDELGKCLQMKFGDWQLFKSAIQALRDAEAFPSTRRSAENMEPSKVVQTKGRSLDSSKSIQFSKPVVNEPTKKGKEDETGARMKRQSSLTRQPSIDTTKDGASSSSGNFAAIKEEDNESMKRVESVTGMSRKDSFVEQEMYESGLLHNFVHTFTEGVSEEDESDNDTTSERDKDLIDMNSSNSSIPKKNPVQFQLSLGSRDGDDMHTVDHNSEKEPLIQTKTTKPKGASPGFPSSTPILKLPILKTPEGFEKLTANKTSFPYLETRQESEVTVHLELQPLIPITKKGSICSGVSGGFDTPQTDPDSVSNTSRSTESFETLAVVDETKDNTDRAVRAGSQQRVSLEESIKRYTRDSLSGSQTLLAGSPERDQSQRIEVKGLKKDKNTPESFV